MKLVAGLGNPGPRYAESRHNLGFMVVDALAQRWRVDASAYEKRFEAQLGEAMRSGQRVFLLKPQTYMNLSGRSVAALARFYRVPLADVLVVYDELDLPLGTIRVRARGSAGGHNGMSDVIRHLSSDQVARVRVGIGKVHSAATVEHVLSRFMPSEREAAEQVIDLAADAVECWLARGATEAMNQFNRKPGGRRNTDEPSKGDQR